MPNYTLWIVLVYLIVLTCIHFRVTPRHIVDRFLPEFNAFERKRLKIYIENLTQNPSSEIHHTPPETVLFSFNPDSKYHYKKTVQDKETANDLARAEPHLREHLQNTLMNLSSFPDSIYWFETPVLTKARHIHGKSLRTPYAVIGRFRTETHFGNVKKAIALRGKTPYAQKKSAIVWRGGPSGTGFNNTYEAHLIKPSREDMLKLWCNHPEVAEEIDVGMISKWQYKDFQQYLKNKLSLDEMVKYKYLLSVEGNDVATNLKWAMASDCLVIMPQPRVESWFAESLLQPWVHYVPVGDDFSDLYAVKQWCDANPDMCQEIIQNANRYVEQFTNETREEYLFHHILRKYCTLVRFNVGPSQARQ